jgi:hypothetical protein
LLLAALLTRPRCFEDGADVNPKFHQFTYERENPFVPQSGNYQLANLLKTSLEALSCGLMVASIRGKRCVVTGIWTGFVRGGALKAHQTE